MAKDPNRRVAIFTDGGGVGFAHAIHSASAPAITSLASADSGQNDWGHGSINRSRHHQV